MAAAAQALDEGDGPRAAADARSALASRPAGEAAARARLALGVALDTAGHPDDAWPVLREAIPDLPRPVRPSALRRLAASLERSGHPGSAAAALAEAAIGAASPGDARAEGRALLAAGRPELAARALEPAADAGDPAARLALARARHRLGDSRGAALLRVLWIERAGDAEGEQAGRELEDWRRSQDPLIAAIAAPVSAERLARAERLLATARPRPALVEIDEAEVTWPSPRSRLLRSVALLQLGRPAEAEATARPLADGPAGSAEARAAEWVLARAASRLGRLDEAAERYRRVAASRPLVPGLPAAQQAELPDEAAYLAAWLAYDAGRFREAAARLRGFAREHPAARRAPDARWFAAWSLRRLGRNAEARRSLRALAAGEQGALRAAALYWLARLETSPSRADALDRAAVNETPDGWYGLLAKARLAARGVTAPTPPLPPGVPPEAPRDADAAALGHAADLFAAGLRAEGLAALDRSSRGAGARGRAAQVAELAAFAGDVRIPHRMARDHLPATRQTERWAFPEAFAASLFPMAAALGVDPSLTLAVMRRESAFDAGARSAAAAEGVLQLRPETAERLAALLGLDLPAEGALTDPAFSIGLGTAYLALLGSRFPDAPALLAAYNAGPAAAARWVAAADGTPLDEWVENLPYRETRHYVRGVVADWARYRRLRGEPPPPLDPALPVRPTADGIAF